MNIRGLPRIRCWVYSAVTVCCCTLLLPSCSSNRNSVPDDSGSYELAGSATPPFSTQEPSRYQAVRTITSSETGSSETRVTRSKIARDGLMRREEYETAPGDSLVYLEIPAGRFVLLPSARLIADWHEVSPNFLAETPQQAADHDLSTERLLNQIAVETRYQRLGPETVNDRSTTKYRVLPNTEARAANSETLMWIDDTLKMPVRWETNTTSGEKQTKTVMELTEISLVVDARTFAVPADYRKVDSRALQKRTGGSARPLKSSGGKN